MSDGESWLAAWIKPCRLKACLRAPLDTGLRYWCSLLTVQSIAVKLCIKTVPE